MEGVIVAATAAGGQDLGSRRRRLAASDRNHAAGHPQLPRVRRHRAGRGVQRRPGKGKTSICRAARNTSNDQRLHRRRRPEELRASTRRRRPARIPRRPGNPFPQLAIGEYKVITSNYKAEYDQVSGAAITAVTKSGTNEFQAEAFMSTRTRAGARRRRPSSAGGDKKGGTSKGIRHRRRRSDHQGQDALLLHLRRQGVHDAQYRRRASVARR